MQPSGDIKEFLDNIKRLPLAAESLDSRGLYIYDDGFRFVIWFGKMLPPDVAMNLLGQDFAAELSRVCYVIFVVHTEWYRYFVIIISSFLIIV